MYVKILYIHILQSSKATAATWLYLTKKNETMIFFQALHIRNILSDFINSKKERQPIVLFKIHRNKSKFHH